MSFYEGTWYRGIVKPEYSADMERVFTQGWQAVGSPFLRSMIDAAVEEYPDTAPFGVLSPDDRFPENGYDPAAREFTIGGEWNIRNYYWTARSRVMFITPAIK